MMHKYFSYLVTLLISIQVIQAQLGGQNPSPFSTNIIPRDSDYLRQILAPGGTPKTNQNQQKFSEKPFKYEDQEPFSKLVIHIIPHSHTDPGWLNTPENYYKASVIPILNSVMKYLKEDENTTFIYAEMYFFEQWWNVQNNQTKSDVAQYIKDGRLEIVNGGWVASDEACPLYFDLLENIKRGHDFLKKQFGFTPKVAWHADSFGHSSQTAKLFKELGFEAFFFGRMKDEYKERMIQTQDMAFIWNPKFVGIDSDYQAHDGIYSHLTHNIYATPCDIGIGSPRQLQTFDFDGFIRRNFKVEGNKRIIRCLEDFTMGYKTQNILMMFGDDFAYSDAKVTFNFIDRFTEKIAQFTDRYVFKYSTFSRYLKDLKEELKYRNLKLNAYSGDFLPLKMFHYEHYWNGFYTSRPNHKDQIRQFTQLAQYSLNEYVQYQLSQDKLENLEVVYYSQKLMEEWALLMHHDTITGTSIEYVMRQHIDQVKLLNYQNTDFLNRQVSGNIYQGLFENLRIDYHNIQDDHDNPLIFGFQTVIYTLIHNPNTYNQFGVRLRVLDVQLHYKVRVWDWTNRQFNDVKIDVLNLKNYEQNDYADLFVALNIAPFSHEIFEITYGLKPFRQLQKFEKNQLSKLDNQQEYDQTSALIEDEIIIEESSGNELVFEKPDTNESTQETQHQNIHREIGFKDSCLLAVDDANSREIKFILKDLVHNMTVKLTFQFKYYSSYVGYKDQGGIYVFKTKQSESSYFSDELILIQKQSGDYQTSIQFTYKSRAKNTLSIVTVYLTRNEDGCGDIEFDVKRDGLDVNVEATVNFSSEDIQNNGIFYTDSNGLEYVKRLRRNGLEEIDLKSTAPANFYPINTGIFIENNQKSLQMIVMNDRPQAGSGFRDGIIELLFNRRVLTADGLGNPELLNEMNERSEPIRTHNKYFIRFTKSREQAFKAITERTIKTLNPVRMFNANRFNSEKAQQNDFSRIRQHQYELSKILNQLDIVDYKLIPDSEFEIVLLWLQQFNHNKSSLKIVNREHAKKIIELICKISDKQEVDISMNILQGNCNQNRNFEFTKSTGQHLKLNEEHQNEYSLYKIITIQIMLNKT
ncbi:glycosyl hydrolases family 38 protein [Stylonychia lemnae]|uniref:Glycosyl hydrolases family 38 protein n=1 Tax=Stylonychia lemnae TaxID=5949 RepID=A0A078ACC2_STYLE|nr:glycosyl hydrolases family 38 protein [Stylonychia lemnae]|eukprot:CDW79486.1 glycosyl hydrolases family 38 protein [Stylonychia lemnae]